VDIDFRSCNPQFVLLMNKRHLSECGNAVIMLCNELSHKFVMFLAASLTIKRKRLILLTCRLDHLVCVSVGRSVCLSGKCTVAKRLNGSGCRLGW